MRWNKILKEKLTALAIEYARKRDFLYIANRDRTAGIFEHAHQNFHPASYNNIMNNNACGERVNDGGDWLKSNSSAVLLMNIFCYPRVAKTKGIRKLLGLPEWVQPKFEVTAGVRRHPARNRNDEIDNTQLDMVIGDVIIEAKLTEADFGTSDEPPNYYGFETVFHVNMLHQQGKKFKNYQLIRNVLAARQMKKRFFLICDYRRPDLIRDYLELIKCIRSYADRNLCNLLTWQDICRRAPRDLKKYLLEKYNFY